jgi:hypothetical protein
MLKMGAEINLFEIFLLYLPGHEKGTEKSANMD